MSLDESDQKENKERMQSAPSPLAIASMVLSAPGWARVGITAPDKRLREAAAMELAASIIERMDEPIAIVLEGQMALPL